MARILLIGTGPPPSNTLERVDFPRLRTWHFLRGLLHAGHDLWWASSAHLNEGATEDTGWHPLRFEGQRLHLFLVTPELFHRPDLPAHWIDTVQPDVVISAGPFSTARAAARIPRPIPVWIDLPGDTMAEALLRASATGQREHLAIAHRVHMAALERGDAFSVISQPQSLATEGQLALLGGRSETREGRLITLTPPVSIIPVGVEPLWHRWAAGALDHPSKTARVIWPGAFNTWADVQTFFEAVTLAMDGHPELEAVVTGGPIPGHEERSWEALRQRIQASHHASRWRLTGWLPPAEAAREVTQATVGLSLDKSCLEARLGSRTRLLYGTTLGLHWIVTPASALARELVAAGLATSVPTGDVTAIAETLLAQVSQRLRAKPGEEEHAARAHLLQRHEASRLLAPLLSWVASPTVLPPAWPLDGALRRHLDELETALAAIHHSPTWRILGGLHRRLQFLFRRASAKMSGLNPNHTEEPR